MAASLALTKDDLLKLHCSNCRNYLSVPPIRLKAGNFFCGRCSSSGERVTIYEELAKYMTFPCSFRPCPSMLKWGEVKTHESNCSHNVINCPKPNCILFCNKLDLQTHFVKKHKELLYDQKLQMKRRLKDMPFTNFNKDRAAYLLQNDNEPYLVMVYSTCKKDVNDPMYIGSYSYNFGVFYLHKNEKTKTHYDLSVTLTDDEGQNTLYSWHNEPIKEYNSSEHCLGCLDRTCYKGHLNKDPKLFLWNRLNNFVNDCRDYVISYSVKLVQKVQPVTNTASSTDNSTLSSKFECPICYEFLVAPIYNCTNGHSLCSNCRNKVKQCALCQADIGNSRNYVLENISESLEICCPNAIRGCSYVGKVCNTKQHLTDCTF